MLKGGKGQVTNNPGLPVLTLGRNAGEPGLVICDGFNRKRKASKDPGDTLVSKPCHTEGLHDEKG